MQATLHACRFLQLHQQVLHREMMLKLGRQRRWQEVPYVQSVTCTISTAGDM
jgi:hypothetical protein